MTRSADSRRRRGWGATACLVTVVFAASCTSSAALTPTASPAPSPPTTPATAAAVTTPPATVADRDAVGRLFGECVADAQVPVGHVEIGGVGPVVAVVGDSLTSQIRGDLLTDGSRRWVVWSRCGATAVSANDSGVMPAVLAEHPAVLLVALGTNDAGFPEPQPGAAAAFGVHAGALLAAVPPDVCVVWVAAAQVGDAVLQTEMGQVNADVAALRGVQVADWGRVVATRPGLLVDRVHLSRAGAAARVSLLRGAVDGCLRVTAGRQDG